MSGVDRVAVVMGLPFSVTRTFLALIQAYILWLNLIVILAKGKHLLKERERERERERQREEKGMKRKGMASLTLTLFLLNVKVVQDEGRWFRTKAIEGKSPRVH